ELRTANYGPRTTDRELRTANYGPRTTDRELRTANYGLIEMCDEWMPVVELPLTPEQFHQLPRNPAYRYEYLGSKARLSPRTKHFHALLDLAGFAEGEAEVEDTVSIRPLVDNDWPGLEVPFRAALSRVQPFASLLDHTLAEAT